MIYNVKSEKISFFRFVGVRALAGLLLGFCSINAMAGQASYELTPGSAAMINNGLQIYGYVTNQINGTPAQNYWEMSNFTGYSLGLNGSYSPELLGNPGTFNWMLAGVQASTVVKDEAVPYYPGLNFWIYGDEQDLGDPVKLQDATQWMNAMRADPRTQGILLGTNQTGVQLGLASLKNYMSVAHPDVLMFDSYPFGDAPNYTFTPGDPFVFYRSLSKYRAASVAGNDGTGKSPIPFGLWSQEWARQDTATPYRVSESEMRLNQFAAWAFGAKFVSAFTYDDYSRLDTVVGQVLFNANGQPTPAFYAQAETNRQSRNLGRTLVRLVSTDVRMVNGPKSNIENGIATFDSTANPYIKSLSATNLGTTNEGAPGDVILGLFRPLTIEGGDDTYFMVVNGLTWTDTSAADTSQRIHIDFDFGDSGITELQRLSRDTGQVELVPLISDGGSLYHLDLVLPGGTGDLFKFDTGSAFLVPEPGAMFTFMALAAVAIRRPRRSK